MRPLPTAAHTTPGSGAVISNALKFLQLLLSPSGTAALKDNGPAPTSPALVSQKDFGKLPKSLQPLVHTMNK
jgi:hypothetical protein